jgi:hypothetical protein
MRFRYIYDLRIPSGLSEQEKAAFKPRPLDGEVESFEVDAFCHTPLLLAHTIRRCFLLGR